MEILKKMPVPPWDMDRAAARLVLEEAAWNTNVPERILAGYSDDIEMRDGTTLLKGKEEFGAFLKRKFEEQLNFTLKLDLWGALKGRMAVRFTSEWQNASGQWHRSHG